MTDLPAPTPWQSFVKCFVSFWIYAYAGFVGACLLAGLFMGVICLAEC